MVDNCHLLYQSLPRKCARNTVTGEDSSDVGEDELNEDLELDEWDHVDLPVDAGQYFG